MGFKGVTVNKASGGLGRHNPAQDGVMLLVVGSAVAASGLALKTAKQYLTLVAAEADGITASYDDANSILAHYHIDEFFRVSPNGNLFVILDDNSMTDLELQAVLKTNQSIKGIGYVRNGDAPADFAAYIGLKQTLVADLRNDNRLISTVLVEGKEFDAATGVAAYDDLRALNAPNVSVVIAQDPIIRNIKAAYQKHAAIGTALGAISVRGVNENLGSVDIENKPNFAKANRDYPLTDIGRQRFLTAVLQNGVDFATLSGNDITALNAKGYIFIGFFNAYAGYFFSDSHTCVETASDYARIENNRVWDKGANLLRQSLLPRVKANMQKDPDTGFIRDAEATELEVLGKKAIDTMGSEISGSDVYIDVAQDLTNDVPLKVKAQIVFNNIIHGFEVSLGLTNKI